ncbi:hypothetical protein K2Y11_04825 [bacterium]|nr:hypothetical protein [bacterium]
MGLPAVIIPDEDTLSKISTALNLPNSHLRDLPISSEDSELGMLAAYECKSDAGDSIVITVQRTNTNLIIAVLRPTSGPILRRDRFSKLIENSLIAHGAISPRLKQSGR